MVSVPITPGRSVQVQGEPQERLRYAESRNLVGRAMEQAGRALGDAAQDMDAVRGVYDTAAAKKADLAATNEKRELLWTGPDAFFAKKGFAAGDSRQAVEEAIKEINDRHAAALGNQRQAEMFMRTAAERDGADLERIASYSTQEYGTEFKAVSEARRDAFQADAIRYADNPTAYAEQIAAGLGEIDALAQQQSWADERQTAEEEKFLSATHFTAINGKLAANENDAAIALFNRYEEELLPVHRQAIVEKIVPVIEFREDEEKVTTALASAPVAEAGSAPVGGGSLAAQLSAIESNESNGKQFASSGNPLTSSAGAIGIMQVMPGTGPEAARLAGLPWSLEKLRTDAAYNKALGSAYYREQLRRFGDPSMAAAAYNAGPGAMQSARTRARRDGTPNDWLRYLPAETRGYVAKFQRKTGASASAGGSGSDSNFSGAYSALEEMARREKWAPEVLDRRRKRLDQRVNREVQLTNLREDEAYRSALEEAVALGDSFTSVGQITRYGDLAADKQLTLQNMIKRNLSGTEVASNGDTAINLNRMAIQEPDKFMALDLREYKGQVSESEYAELHKSQARLVAKPEEEKSLLESVNSAITFFTTPELKLTGAPNKLRRNRVANAMVVWLRKNVDPAKSPTDSQRRQAFGWAIGEVDGVMRADVETFDVPAQFIEAYGRSYRRMNGRWPSDADVRSAYQRSRAGK